MAGLSSLNIINQDNKNKINIYRLYINLVFIIIIRALMLIKIIWKREKK